MLMVHARNGSSTAAVLPLHGYEYGSMGRARVGHCRVQMIGVLQDVPGNYTNHVQLVPEGKNKSILLPHTAGHR